MNNEKVTSNQSQGDNPYNKIPEVHSSEPSVSDTEILKKLYLPGSKAANRPSEGEIERANNLNYSKPNTLL